MSPPPSGLDADPIDLALAWLGRGQPEKALEALARVDGAALDEALPWVIRLRALISLERWEEAVGAATQALARFPEDVQLLYSASQVARHHGDSAAAERHLLAALRLRPENPGLLCGYAELVAGHGQVEKADALLDRAARIAPESDRVLRTRWVLANLRGDDDGAREIARQRLGRAPDDPNALTALAIEELHSGEVAQARRHYGAAVTTDLRGQFDPGLALELRVRSHPAWIPMRPIERWGSWRVAIGGILLLQVAGVALPPTVVLPASLGWVVYCVYTWVAPPLLRRHLSRTSR